MTLAFFVESVKAMPAGFGRNMYEVTGLQLVGYLERLLTLAYTYIWPPTLTKLSILILYWRISPNTVFRACIVAIAVVVVGYSITFTVLFAGPCNPLLGTPESALCLNKIAVSQAVLNIVTDGMIILLPIPTIHALNMPLKQRITVGCILGLGSAYVTSSFLSFPPLSSLSPCCAFSPLPALCATKLTLPLQRLHRLHHPRRLRPRHGRQPRLHIHTGLGRSVVPPRDEPRNPLQLPRSPQALCAAAHALLSVQDRLRRGRERRVCQAQQEQGHGRREPWAVGAQLPVT